MPTLAELAEQLECPAPRPPRPLDQFDLLFETPQSVAPGDLYRFEIRGGVWDRPGGGMCGHVTASTIRDGQVSEVATLSTDGSPDCKPVPEPSLAGALLFGALWLGVATALGPVIGRRLRDLRRKNAPED